MSGYNIVTIGVSADDLGALKTIVGKLPSEFPAAVFIVSHAVTGGSRVLADILSCVGLLRAVYPEGRDPIQSGRIYAAPPDHHMSIEHRPAPSEMEREVGIATGEANTPEAIEKEERAKGDSYSADVANK